MEKTDKIALSSSYVPSLASEITTIEKAMTSQYPALVSIRKVKGEAEAMKVMVGFIAELMKYINVERTFTSEQVKKLAVDILDEYYYLKTADIRLFFDRIVKGYYGEIYNNLSMEKVHIWLRKYVEERMMLAEDRSLANHDKNKEKTNK